MAAKPPKPPGNFLNNNQQTTPTKPTAATNDTFNNNNNRLFNHHNSSSNNNNNIIIINNNNNNCDDGQQNVEHVLSCSSNHADDTAPPSTSSAAPHSCNCSNINIMHLFHEMKQEFPTIPDQIVAQCVNENCHQRENCISMLQQELALHPVQTYPAKVLQRQQKLNQQQQQQQQSAANSPQQQQQPQSPKPNTPLKPIRVAPTPSPTVAAAASALTTTSNLTTQLATTENTTQSIATAAAVNNVVGSAQPTQRLRPTTLALNLPQQQQQQQQQLRQQLNVQLQQRLQQRQGTKPVRKAPLPPIAPKPTPSQLSQHNQLFQQQHQQHQHQHNNNNKLPQHGNNTTTPTSEALLAASSPTISSGGESEISVNVSLSSPATTPSSVSSSSCAMLPPSLSSSSSQQHKSPARHRSVINVLPEAPYTRDFLISPTSSSSGGSTSNGTKSFTSVNLTLRPPNACASPTTIDISAGPGLSGAGGATGLTYSSTSYDARRGCQKNFHITVTDEGGIFSASRIRPPNTYYSGCGDEELDGGRSSGASGAEELTVNTAQQQQPLWQQRNVANANNSNISNNVEMCRPNVSDGFTEILQRQRARRDKLSTALRDNKKRLSQVEQEINVLTEPASPGQSERLDSEIQRLRCDCETMLNEIENSKRGVASSTASDQVYNAINNRQTLQQQQQLLEQQQQQQQQQQNVLPPQPFPRQRPPRPPPPHISTRQPQLDFVQHHSSNSGSASGVGSSSSAQNSPSSQQLPSPHSLQTYQQQLQQQFELLQQRQILQQQHILQQQQQQQQQRTPQRGHATSIVPDDDDDEEEYSDSTADGAEDDDEGLERWACNMCTFRNHPQLNICECCENVRILPAPVLNREDIHITLSPGENRIVHSWIVS